MTRKEEYLARKEKEDRELRVAQILREARAHLKAQTRSLEISLRNEGAYMQSLHINGSYITLLSSSSKLLKKDLVYIGIKAYVQGYFDGKMNLLDESEGGLGAKNFFKK